MATEREGRDPREVQSALMSIQEAFKQSPEAGVATATQRLYELRRGTDPDPELAAFMAEQLDLAAYGVPKNLQGAWDKVLGETYLYGGKEGNDFLDKAAEKYSQLATRSRGQLPEDLESIPDGEKPDGLSDFFHARDRQGDATFLSGDFEAAVSAYQLAVESRGKFASQEPGPVACAIYGEGAALFMQGKVNEALECIEQARNLLKEKRDEETLSGNIGNLETAAMALDELDPTVRDERLAAMKALLKQNGGKDGGVKRIDFQQLFDDAEREAENLDI